MAPVSLDELMASFDAKSRSVLSDAVVEESGTIQISTKKGANLTNDAIIDALKKRDACVTAKEAEMKAKALNKTDNKNKNTGDTKIKLRRNPNRKTPSKLRDFMKLAPRRALQLRRLQESRSYRRKVCKHFARQLKRLVDNESPPEELQHLLALALRRRVLFEKLKENGRGRRMARMLRTSGAAARLSLAV
ncbi:hypothetical protein FGB62_22g612 [Gracilaria domingensis]|nr:hypothetical protein FGB62_22g612 [Gracilaria domingensis]